jgi:hypothetical protein
MVLLEGHHRALVCGDERFHHTRIELTCGSGPNLSERLLHGPGGLVWPVVGECVEHVGHGDDPAGERDRLAGQAGRVAVSVPALVVTLGDYGSQLQHEMIVAIRSRARGCGPD